MTPKNDRLFYVIAGLLAAMAAFYAFAASREPEAVAPAAPTAGLEAADAAPAPAPAAPEPAKAVAKPPAAPAPLTYDRALELYGTYRIQFVNCSGNPGRMVLGKGAKLMLDNRDKKAHTVKVGSVSYKLGATSFAIATVREVGTLNVTCDGGGAATVEVQP